MSAIILTCAILSMTCIMIKLTITNYTSLSSWQCVILWQWQIMTLPPTLDILRISNWLYSKKTQLKKVSASWEFRFRASLCQNEVQKCPMFISYVNITLQAVISRQVQYHTTVITWSQLVGYAVFDPFWQIACLKVHQIFTQQL